MKRGEARPPIRVTADGKGLVSHAGTRLLADMAERSGLQDNLSVAMSPPAAKKSGSLPAFCPMPNATSPSAIS